MKSANIVASLGFIAFAIIVIAYTHTVFPSGSHGVPGPGVFPIMVSSVMLLAGLTILFNHLRLKESEPILWFQKDSIRVYITMGIMIVYAFLTPIVGFFVTTFIFLVLIIKWFSKRSVLYSSAYALGITGFVYVSFSIILRVPLRFGFLF